MAQLRKRQALIGAVPRVKEGKGEVREYGEGKRA
jgi:hypothetical protein